MKTDASGLRRANGLIAAAATDAGRVRDHNEDVFYLNLETGIFLVVDGVGGHAAGEVAASIAEDRIRRRVERQDAPAHVRVREAITLANREILLKAESDPRLDGMACVLTLAVLEGQELTIGHVGDSRLYRLDARGISKLTHDHSPIGELEDAREITETDAMLNERRNEVYRDVGSEPRDPDAEDFIELIRTRFDDDAALLICSDGLTDLLPALELNRIVRLHAGAPDAAVAALINAANEAGGKDNITVIVVEGPRFRRTPDGGRAYPPPPPESQVPTLPLVDPVPTMSLAANAPPIPDAGEDVGGGFGRLVHAVMHSRSVALAGGAVLGVLFYAGLAYAPENAVTRATERLLEVSGTNPKSYPTIGAALARARSGDVISVEPGTYAESITLPPDVELRAQTPGKVVLVAPSDAKDWTAITAQGAGSTIRGFRIAGTGAAPIARGIAVDGDGVTIDDVTFDGVIGIGVEVSGMQASVRGSQFDRLAGTPIRLQQEGASLRQNVFRSSGTAAPAAVQAVGDVSASLDSNVFMHFPHLVEPEVRAEALIGHDNFVIVPASPPKVAPANSPARNGRNSGSPARAGASTPSTR
jgi:serine/threonine protein phosphatase PrpC